MSDPTNPAAETPSEVLSCACGRYRAFRVWWRLFDILHSPEECQGGPLEPPLGVVNPHDFGPAAASLSPSPATDSEAGFISLGAERQAPTGGSDAGCDGVRARCADRVPVGVTRRTDDEGTISFDAPGFTTVRPCRHCGVLIAGGPTACLPCAARPTAAHLADGGADATAPSPAELLKADASSGAAAAPALPQGPAAELPPEIERAIEEFAWAQRQPAKYRPALGAHKALRDAIRAALARERTAREQAEAKAASVNCMRDEVRRVRLKLTAAESTAQRDRERAGELAGALRRLFAADDALHAYQVEHPEEDMGPPELWAECTAAEAAARAALSAFTADKGTR